MVHKSKQVLTQAGQPHPHHRETTMSEAAKLDAAPGPVEIVAYKGFGLDWKCRDMQYEVGKTYTHEGDVVRCAEGGFHSCENPLDVFGYYPPGTSRYAIVKAAGTIARDNDDTKIASGRITIEAELPLPKMIETAIAWIAAKCSPATSEHATGYRSASSATGYRSASSATGYRSASSATGDQSASSATGDQSASSATGAQAVAAAFGYDARAMAGTDGTIIVAWWDRSARRKRVTVGYVGEDGISEDTWYRCDDAGKLVPA